MRASAERRRVVSSGGEERSRKRDKLHARSINLKSSGTGPALQPSSLQLKGGTQLRMLRSVLLLLLLLLVLPLLATEISGKLALVHVPGEHELGAHGPVQTRDPEGRKTSCQVCTLVGRMRGGSDPIAPEAKAPSTRLEESDGDESSVGVARVGAARVRRTTRLLPSPCADPLRACKHAAAVLNSHPLTPRQVSGPASEQDVFARFGCAEQRERFWQHWNKEEQARAEAYDRLPPNPRATPAAGNLV